MDAEHLNQALYDKMAAEQEAFRADLLGRKPEEILDHAYEYAMRQDILMEMEELELSAAQTAALLSSPTPLADVYREWNKVDARHMEDIRDAIEAWGDSLLKSQRDATRATPLYREDAGYAREHGELDLFQASHQANIACRDAIEAAIRDGFDGVHLRADAKGVLAEFGPERVAHVLAATIQSKDWDERFSRANKAWAVAIPMFEQDHCRSPYIVHIHSTVVNGFVDVVRKELAAMRDQPEQTAEKPSIRGQLAAAKAAQAEKPAAQQHKDKGAR